IVALTHIDWARRQMALEWGVTPLLIPESDDVEELWSMSVRAAREAGIVQTGDRVVITAGTQVNLPGSTNVIKVEIAEHGGGAAAPRAKSAQMPRTKRRRSVMIRRYAAVGTLVLVGLLYYRPLKAYVDAHSQLSQRRATVQQLEAERARLQHRLG